jgi:hypothetical protein
METKMFYVVMKTATPEGTATILYGGFTKEFGAYAKARRVRLGAPAYTHVEVSDGLPEELK